MRCLTMAVRFYNGGEKMEKENGEVKYPIKVDTRTLGPKVNRYVAQAEAFQIVDDETYATAGEALKGVKGLYKDIEGTFAKTKSALNEAKSELMSLIQGFTDPLQRAETILKKKMGEHHAKRERERAEEQRRLYEEARRKAEKEQAKIAKKTGDASILDIPVVVPMVKVEDTTRVEGISYQEVVRFEIVDASIVPAEYKIVDEVAIGRAVRGTDGKIVIPGVRIWKEKIVKSTSRR